MFTDITLLKINAPIYFFNAEIIQNDIFKKGDIKTMESSRHTSIAKDCAGETRQMVLNNEEAQELLNKLMERAMTWSDAS